MRIYVGNLSYNVTQDELQKEFEAYGKVESVSIPGDGQSRGFGFVEMPDKAEADAAIAALNGKNIKGRALTVNEARPRAEGASRGPRKERSY